MIRDCRSHTIACVWEVRIRYRWQSSWLLTEYELRALSKRQSDTNLRHQSQTPTSDTNLRHQPFSRSIPSRFSISKPDMAPQEYIDRSGQPDQPPVTSPTQAEDISHTSTPPFLATNLNFDPSTKSIYPQDKQNQQTQPLPYTTKDKNTYQIRRIRVQNLQLSRKIRPTQNMILGRMISASKAFYQDTQRHIAAELDLDIICGGSVVDHWEVGDRYLKYHCRLWWFEVRPFRADCLEMCQVGSRAGGRVAGMYWIGCVYSWFREVVSSLISLSVMSTMMFWEEVDECSRGNTKAALSLLQAPETLKHLVSVMRGRLCIKVGSEHDLQIRLSFDRICFHKNPMPRRVLR